MGRARAKWSCIPNEKSRKSRFKQRSKGLETKMYKFCTKCGVEACLIAYEDNGDAPPITWPEDPAKVRSIIEKYEAQKNVRPPKIFDLEDFFENRKHMVEAEISRVQKEILKIKYPTWDSHFKSLDEEHLMQFIAILDTKIGACIQRIDMLKNNQQTEIDFNFGQNIMAQSESTAFVSNPSQLNFMHNSSQIQLVPTPMMSLNHDMGSQSEMLHLGPQMPLLDPNLMQLMGNNNGMVDSTNQLEWPLDCIIQNGAIENSTNQLGEPMVHFDPNLMQMMAKNNVMVDFTNRVEVPLDCTEQNVAIVNPTNQLGEPMVHFDPNLMQMMAKNNVMVDFTNRVEVPLDCTEQNVAIVNPTNQLGEPLDWASQYAKAEAWASEFGESESWMNQPCELVDWTSQPSMLVDWTSELQEPDLHIISSQSQNAPQPSHTLPPTLDGVLTYDFNNVAKFSSATT